MEDTPFSLFIMLNTSLMLYRVSGFSRFGWDCNAVKTFDFYDGKDLIDLCSFIAVINLFPTPESRC